MNTNRITVRYAKALYEFASEQKKEKAVNDDMLLIIETIKEVSGFRQMLETPVIFPSKKTEIFNKIFSKKVSDVTLKFFKLLSENKREMYLSAVARNYTEIYRKRNGIKSAKLTTAFIPDDKLKKEVESILSEKFNSKIELETKTDKSIIGGFVLSVEGLQYNAGIAEKLKEIKAEMLNS